MMLKNTYITKAGPSCPSFDEYKVNATKKYEELLASVVVEKPMQDFLEQNPCFVPGAWTPGMPSGHYPLHNALISQPKLSGLRSRQPDFMWIATHSAAWYPTLIEIESPAKKIFKGDAIPTHQFTQARNQLAQWRAWFMEPTNVQKFITEYGIPDSYTKFRNIQPHFVLIYGRRAEFEGNVELSRQRAAIMPGADEELLSFDRLHPDMKLGNAITVRAKGYGRYGVRAVMPTLEMGPELADRLLQVDELKNAVELDSRISQSRQEFLMERIDYWRIWAKSPERGIVNIGDRE